MDLLDKSHYATPELYDLVYSHYRDDLEFYLATAKRSRGPVLEIGSGTGRVLIPLARAGVDIDGLDVRPEMVEALERKLEDLGLEARIYLADMRDFTTPRRYDLILIPFRAFTHNLSTDDQVRTLHLCREHLESGGTLVLNLFHPSLDKLVQPEGQRYLEKEFPHPDTGQPVKVWAAPFRDRVNQRLRCEVEVQELDAAGAVGRSHRYEFTLRWVYKAEMELLLRVAGFTRWEIAGGFDGRPLERDTDEMVVTAWKD